MEVNESDLLSLFRTLDTLKPYLGEIVIVGGWVPFLYRKYGEIPARHPSVRTMDIADDGGYECSACGALQ